MMVGGRGGGRRKKKLKIPEKGSRTVTKKIRWIM